LEKTGTTLAIKFVMTFILAAVAFYFMVRNPWSWILAVSILVTAVNYLIGDLVILPSYGNLVAAIGDGVMAGIVAYIISLLFATFDTTAAALITFGVLIAIGEYFLHQYLTKKDEVETT
jgi:hypothetical protein